MDHKNISSILAEDTDGSQATSLSSSAGVVLNIATITCIGVFGFVIGVGISKFVTKTMGNNKSTDNDDVEDFSQTGMDDPPQCHLESVHLAALRLVSCDHGSSLTRTSVNHKTHTALSTKEDTDIVETPPSPSSAGVDLAPVAARRSHASLPPTPPLQPVGLRGSRDCAYRLLEFRKSSDVSKSTDDGQLLRRISVDPEDEHHIRKETV